MPIHKKKDQLYVYNQNYFYEKWNEINHDELIEFIFQNEIDEILQNINQLKDDLLNVDIRNVFQEIKKKFCPGINRRKETVMNIEFFKDKIFMV